MATRSRKKSLKGTLIRGADGSLYHIPDKDLHAYRLPDELTGEARAFLDRQNVKSKGAHVAALRGEGLVSAVPKKAVMVGGGRTVMMKGKKTVMVAGGGPVMVAGGKTVMVKGKKAVMVGGGKTVMVKGKKTVMVGPGPVMVSGGRTVMVKGKKTVMVNMDRLKAARKRRRK